jgi:hypothetical protein
MNDSAGTPGNEAAKDNESLYFSYDACVRIFGERLNLEEISAALMLQPTRTHRKGDRWRGMRPFEQDMWLFQPPMEESEPLHRHIDALWLALKPHKQCLLELKKSCTVDVFLGYRSSCDHAGVEVPCSSLEMFSELEIPFGLSIIVA